MGAALKLDTRLLMARRPAGDWPKSESSGRPGNGRHRTTTILVVDDEVLIRMPVADYLREKGFRVIEASNAAEAQAVFEAQEPIEVVFSDVNMPGDLNGLGLARWVRAHHPDVKIILASGVTTAAALLPGDVDAPMLGKPYSYDQLAQQIKRLIET